MKKILIGTHNKGKFREIAFLLGKKVIKISHKSLKIKSPRETGKTFLQNSKLKVEYFSNFTNLPIISDDSGLSINALNGRPGIYSARWAKKYGGFKKAMQVILKKMANKKNRKAVFVCSLSFKHPRKKRIFTAVGKAKGKITKKIVGNKGFGYDPIFIQDFKSLTYGQMSRKKKMRLDHRFIAFQKLKKLVKIL